MKRLFILTDLNAVCGLETENPYYVSKFHDECYRMKNYNEINEALRSAFGNGLDKNKQARNVFFFWNIMQKKSLNKWNIICNAESL